MRCVVDTNVTISALLFPQSKPGQAFQLILERGELLLSLDVLRELDEVLSREKFDRYLLREEREVFLAALIREAVLVEVGEGVRACRDPRDDKFLELAISGEAAYLVTGDSDLLELDPFRGLRILTPDTFLQSFERPAPFFFTS